MNFKYKKKLISIYIKEDKLYLIDKYNNIKRFFYYYDTFERSRFQVLVKHYSTDNFNIDISSKDFYLLKKMRYI